MSRGAAAAWVVARPERCVVVVVRGVVVERLYREVRALRIYEGTSEIQKLIIAKALLAR